MAVIGKPIAFVLGAGASKAYGYPTGQELRTKIITELRNQEGLFKRLGNAPFFQKFADEFEKSLVYSIDAFLSLRPRHEIEIAKQLIALALVEYEDADKLTTSNENWFQYLFNQFFRTQEDLKSNKISFITFNYDRSLEQLFHQTFINFFQIPVNDLALKMQNFQIIHLHGQIGPLPWQDKNSTFGRHYRPTMNDHELEFCSKMIKIVHEGASASSEFQNAKHFLEEAEEIYFLGFGFDKENLSRLEPRKLTGKRIFATGRSLGMKKREEINGAFNQIITYQNSNCLESCQIWL